MEKIGMVSTFIKFFFILALVGCVINGCFLAPSFDYSLVWEYPIKVNTEIVQEIKVPYIKRGNTFSICFDKLSDDSKRGYSISKNDIDLYKDKVEASFTIGDTVFFYEHDYLHDFEFACPLNGQRLFKFKLPERISKNQLGTLRIKFKQVDYLEDASNVRVVLFYTNSGRK